MADFAFEKGDDITIRLNGKTVGGVKKATCKIENTFYDISQFLTDAPVERMTGKRYNIELVMNNSGKLDFLQGQSFDCLEIFNTKKTVTYKYPLNNFALFEVGVFTRGAFIISVDGNEVFRWGIKKYVLLFKCYRVLVM